MKKLVLIIAVLALTLSLAITVSAQDDIVPDGDPTFGTFNLRGGFFPDPWILSAFAGGPVNAGTLDTGDAFCNGFIAPVPDLNLEWMDADGGALRIFFQSEGDTTLVIQDPEGNFFCNDDNGVAGENSTFLDPMVEIDAMVEGTYHIWIGTFGEGDFEPGYLMLTEVEETYPGQLFSPLLGSLTILTGEEE